LEVAEAGLSALRSSPSDLGTLELIVKRPAPGERVVLARAELDTEAGLLGDYWHSAYTTAKGRRRPKPDTQVTMMNSRAAALAAGSEDPERWASAGDQLYVDLDLSHANLPAGTRIAIGEAVLEVTAEPHLGCGKFTRAFGVETTKLFNSPEGRELRARGLNARVIAGGTVSPGDSVAKLTD